ETEIEVTFPDEYHAEELAGKEAVFKVHIHEIKEKELPDLDDEFAKDVDDEVETLDELKKKKKEQLEEQKQQNAENAKRDTLIQKATANVEVEIPVPCLKTELEPMLCDVIQNLQRQGMMKDR